MSYAARTKYDQPGRAERYRERSPRRNAEEWRLLAAVLDGLDEPLDALDVPSGTGRIAEALLARGLRVRAADLSPAMREETRARLAGREGFLGVEAIDLEGPVDAEALGAELVVCFRFLHHLPDPASRRTVLASLAALARRDLVVSFHHPVSWHNLSRAIRRVCTGRRGDRHTLTVGRLRREAGAAGLELV